MLCRRRHNIHLIRASMRYVCYGDRKKLAAALRPVYTAANADAAQTALLELADSELGKKHRSAIAVWERAWDRFIPFLEFPPEIRKTIPTINAVRVFHLPSGGPSRIGGTSRPTTPWSS